MELQGKKGTCGSILVVLFVSRRGHLVTAVECGVDQYTRVLGGLSPQ